jgi:AAA family ATP:ADP antiporter
MPVLAPVPATLSEQSRLDRALSVFAEVRAGEGATAVLMLVNIFLLLVCYSVVKTVREPLILLGGGAEVRSYAAAGQALLLMGFVPLYSWLASRLDRIKLLVGVTLLFILCIELFAAAVAARVPYVGVAFFIWVGIFNISLVAQFWSFANDIYRKPAGDRLFPIIVMGMTAGAPLGSIVSARLFRLGMDPQSILQISVLLLAVSVLLYLWINAREPRHIAASEPPMSSSGGFRLVLNSGYLRLIAALIVLLNIVNTTGEYLISRLLTAHVNQLALLDPGFDRQAFIGAYVGEYQFWVNVTAFILQAFVASRLVKYQGLAGVLLALPLIALGGYAIVALGAGLSLVRWIKTAENAADYSLMNTARQLLWLPTSREEKYKAKQAIDTFFVRAGDVLSAGVVYAGTSVLYLTEAQFAGVNVALTLAWLALAARILHPGRPLVRMPWRRVATASAVVLIAAVAHPASAQETREEQLAAARAEKAEHLHPYRPTPAERWILRAENMLRPDRPVYLFMGSAFEGGGLAAGPGYRAQFADSGVFNAHAGWSARNYKVLDAKVDLPALANGRLLVRASGHWLDAPSVAFYGVGNSTRGDRRNYAYRAATVGVSARVEAARGATLGAGVDMIAIDSVDGSPTYRRSRLFAAFDSRPSPAYARRGGLYRIDWSDYRDLRTGGRNSFRRIDAEVDRFIPLLRENWVIALRAAASSTSARSGDDVPHFLMPDVGGSDTLRGYPARRFRDRHRMILTGEYRWTAGPFVDMALFMDAGKVADRFRDLDLRGLKTSYGIGLTLHTPSRTIARIELARTREGMGVVVSFSPNF